MKPSRSSRLTTEGAGVSYLPPEAEGPSSSAQEQWRKLFVGGISWDVSEEELRKHFAVFGLVEATVMKDRVTGRGRGFGFLQFDDPEAAERALKDPNPTIRGRTVEVKRAIPRGEIYQKQNWSPHQSRELNRKNNGEINNGNCTSLKKIFVGGLPNNITPLELRNFFEKFGSVSDTAIMFDNTTQRPRGFGFITFSSESPVAMVLQSSFYELKGKIVQVKAAIPKDDINVANNRFSHKNHNPRTLGVSGEREHVYDCYQHPFYPAYENYGYFNYYDISPYPYGGPYGGGYTPGGLHVPGYEHLFGFLRSPSNGTSGLVAPVFYPYVAGGFGSSMFVPTLGYTGDHGSDINNENEGGPDVPTLTVDAVKSPVQTEDAPQISIDGMNWWSMQSVVYWFDLMLIFSASR